MSRWSTDPAADMSVLLDEVQQKLTEQLEQLPEQHGDQATREQHARTLIGAELDRVSRERLQNNLEVFTEDEEIALENTVIHRVFGLGRLQALIDDPELTDIKVNGFDEVWLTYRNGEKRRGEPIANSDDELIALVQTAARRVGLSERSWDYASPMLDLQLPSGDRLNALAWVCTRPSLSIRRHDFNLTDLKQLLNRSISPSLFHFLSAAVRAKLNIIIAGGTGAGKTTLLRCLINEIDPRDRIITVEDSLELGIGRLRHRHPDLVEIEARQSNAEGAGEFTMADAVRNTLRMSPDRVIVGEIRGVEVLPMLLAMSQGNDGSCSTIHADSSASVFQRLQLYMAMTPERFPAAVTNMMVAQAINLVVHIASTQNQRVVTSIREVRGAENESVFSNEIYAPDDAGRAVPATQMSGELLDRLESVGFDRQWHTTNGGWG